MQFEHADIGTYAAATQFDAVVGRYILLYQPDPVAAIRKLATLVRSASRLEAEAVSLGCQLAGPVQVGAWVTLA